MSSHGGNRARPNGINDTEVDATAKNRMVQEIIQEAVDATEREVIQEREADQMGLIGQSLNFSRDRPKEKELFNDHMNFLRELALIRKRHHAKWKETQELALMEELKDGVKLEGWGKQFFPTPSD